MNNKSTVPTPDEIWKILRETSAMQKENSVKIKELSAEVKKTKEISETQWGRLMESLVEGKLVELLSTREIKVRQINQRANVYYTKKDSSIQRREFDIIVVNSKEVVAVEVKTTLTPKKAKYFLESLKDFKKYFPEHKSKKVYGAVAYLRSVSEAHLFSQRQGLFIIRATEDSASIVNDKDFKPKVFSENL